MKHNATHRVTTTTHHTIVMSAADVIKHAARKESVKIPDTAQVTITVPSGGDYSGDTVDLDECGGVTITWSETTEEQP